MEFGISMRLLGAKEARQAERLSYDCLLTGEHVMLFHTRVAKTLISLAAAAGATERIKLMSGIVLVPLYPAALLPKQVAMLDGLRRSLSPGHRGGRRVPKEFAAVGVQ
jgi:alkanesulfonate monooxygenase SsuD/methylene tetrahydromethanopterin reductase-like flavin-dependent oxidoreductase (luciferase family)